MQKSTISTHDTETTRPCVAAVTESFPAAGCEPVSDNVLPLLLDNSLLQDFPLPAGDCNKMHPSLHVDTHLNFYTTEHSTLQSAFSIWPAGSATILNCLPYIDSWPLTSYSVCKMFHNLSTVLRYMYALLVNRQRDRSPALQISRTYP